jgi:hypothetical protein
MGRWGWGALVTLLAVSCGGDTEPRDAGPADAAPVPDASMADGEGPDADATPTDSGSDDAGVVDSGAALSLAALRDRLLSTLTDAPCATWATFDVSERAVFLMITHRLHLARTPDGRSVLEHVDGLHLVRGGGDDGTTCGGGENNRLFLSMDDYLWARAVETWDGASTIDDGSGSTFIHTRDIAGPHDPFDASIETDTGLVCTLLIEQSSSRPPTAQAHFFLEGSAVPVERGSDISLPADPTMLEIDLDFDCIHRSNPTCRDFETRYRDNYGDFECEWVPSSCTPEGSGCYRSVTP